MESDKIEKLLDKYFEATTTAAEETALKDYFSGDAIAPHLKRYAPMFQFFEVAKAERSTQPLQLDSAKVESMSSKTRKSKSQQSKHAPSKSPLGSSSRKLWYTWGSVAAMVLIMVGIYFSFDMADDAVKSENDYAQLQNQYTQEEIAAAQEALALLSTKFSKGTEQLSHLNEFEKNTNRFLSEKQ